ncbi:MAG: aspartate aminotransferase family protein [Sandaracinaceae bacterium]
MTDIDALLEHALVALSRPETRVTAGSPSQAQRAVDKTDLQRARSPRHAVSELVKLVRESGVRTHHRRHFGWMNAPAHPAATVADLLVSGLNPQLAARAMSPGPVAAEARLVASIAERLGFGSEMSGHFTSGGSEANATALVCALTAKVPGFTERGLAGGPRLRVYASTEAHDSLEKAVRAHGLGNEGLVRVAVDDARQMDLRALASAIERDRSRGWQPVMVVSTAGTTNVGAIDPLRASGTIARREGLWHHVDAAWGGLLAFTDRAGALEGLGDADSAAFDPHKALGAPMGTGMVFVRDDALDEAFSTRPAYGPDSQAPDPYKRSLIWSRRFVGARLWLPLLLDGWPELERRAQRRVALGADLRRAVEDAGFAPVGPASALPVVCFVAPNRDDAHQTGVARRIAQSGDAWIATTRLDAAVCLRACICSDETDASDLDQLSALLAKHLD